MPAALGKAKRVSLLRGSFMLLIHSSCRSIEMTPRRYEARCFSQAERRHVVINAFEISRMNAVCFMPMPTSPRLAIARLNAAHAGRCSRSGSFAYLSKCSKERQYCRRIVGLPNHDSAPR